MSYLSKHYFCICNCRLNAFMSVCNTSMPLQMKLLRFLCIAKMHFVDTDLICLVTAQMFEIYRPISQVCQTLEGVTGGPQP